MKTATYTLQKHVEHYGMMDAWAPIFESPRWAIWLKQPVMLELPTRLLAFSSTDNIEILATLAYLMRWANTSKKPLFVPVKVYVKGTINLRVEEPIEESQLRQSVIACAQRAAKELDVKMTVENWRNIQVNIDRMGSWENMVSVLSMGTINMLL